MMRITEQPRRITENDLALHSKKKNSTIQKLNIEMGNGKKKKPGCDKIG